MSSSVPKTPLSDEPESRPTSSTLRISPDAAQALLLFTLMERYQEVAGCLKVLRVQRLEQEQQGTLMLTPKTQEALRSKATGLFNHLYRLVQMGLLTPEGFALVIEPRAARLWLDNVAQLDAAVRAQACTLEGRKQPYDPGEHPVERFYQKYAETGRLMLRVSKEPDPHTH